MRRVEQFRDSVFADNANIDMVLTAQGADSILLSSDRNLIEWRILQGLAGDHNNLCWCLIQLMSAQACGEFCHVTQHGGFWFFSAVHTQCADADLTRLGHVCIRVPKPLNEPSAGRERERSFALQ